MTIAKWVPAEVPGEIIQELRSRKRTGELPSQLVRFLEDNNMQDVLASQSLRIAFCLATPKVNLMYLRKGAYGGGAFDYQAIDQRLDPLIEEARSQWEAAPPYPDLMSRAHREIFRSLARRRQCRVLVRAAHPESGKFLGKEGFRAAPAHLCATPCNLGLNAGLMAADPGDEYFRDLLATLRPPRSYAQYVQELASLGLGVGRANEGYPICSERGVRFYPTYFIQGVYSGATNVNIWRAPEGENIRRELNTRLGEELVRLGPQDAWEHRNDREVAGPAIGPQLPIIYFDPAGDAGVVLDAKRLEQKYEYWGISWPFSNASN